MTFNDILEVLGDMTGSFMSNEQRQVCTVLLPDPFILFVAKDRSFMSNETLNSSNFSRDMFA